MILTWTWMLKCKTDILVSGEHILVKALVIADISPWFHTKYIQ